MRLLRWSCIEQAERAAGVVAQMLSDLTGFLGEELQMWCTAVSRFNTNSHRHNLLAAILMVQPVSFTTHNASMCERCV